MITVSLYNIAEIDVKKLLYNLKQIKNVAKCNKICAVVKANAYGHGAVGIAVKIERYVDCFAVALVEEGVELRLAGIVKPVLVLIPTDDDGVERAAYYDLTLTADGINSAYKYNAICEKIRENLKVHLKVDTGMHRLGFDPKDTGLICRTIKSLKKLSVTGCYSHFANALDEERTELQFSLFEKVSAVVMDYFPKSILHVSASGGICANDKYSLDMVRPGLLLYGYKPFNTPAIDVKPILKIKAKVVCERVIDEGEGILYGDYHMGNCENVAILRCGYADGLRRNCGDTINVKCMDTCAVKSFKNQDTICVFDNAELIAKNENTIPYEVLCSLGKRTRIVYKE